MLPLPDGSVSLQSALKGSQEKKHTTNVTCLFCPSYIKLPYFFGGSKFWGFFAFTWLCAEAML